MDDTLIEENIEKPHVRLMNSVTKEVLFEHLYVAGKSNGLIIWLQCIKCVIN